MTRTFARYIRVREGLGHVISLEIAAVEAALEPGGRPPGWEFAR